MNGLIESRGLTEFISQLSLWGGTRSDILCGVIYAIELLFYTYQPILSSYWPHVTHRYTNTVSIIYSPSLLPKSPLYYLYFFCLPLFAFFIATWKHTLYHLLTVVELVHSRSFIYRFRCWNRKGEVFEQAVQLILFITAAYCTHSERAKFSFSLSRRHSWLLKDQR
jgi:hypothetical protein